MSFKPTILTLLLSVTPLIAACRNTSTTTTTTTPTAATAPADPAPINDLRNRFQAAYNAGDAAAVAALYTDDAVSLPPNHEPLRGKAAIQQHLQETFAQVTANMTLSAPDTEISGDIAHETGSYTTTITPKSSGKAMTETGKYLVVLKRQPDGSWKVHHDMDNSNTPMAMPGMPMPGAGRR